MKTYENNWTKISAKSGLGKCLQEKEKCRRRYKQHKKKQEELREDFRKKVNERRAEENQITIRQEEKIAKNAFKTSRIFGDHFLLEN